MIILGEKIGKVCVNKSIDIAYDMLCWKDVREQAHTVNSALATKIDAIDPSADFPLVKLTYPYGSLILENGQLFLPLKNSLDRVPLNDPSVPTALREALDYNPGAAPVSLVLKNTIELFMQHDGQLSTFICYSEGDMTSLWRMLDGDVSYHPDTLWNVSAGVRSIVMLPKISEKNAFNRLRKAYYLSPYSPRGFNDHWYIFREIANHKSFGEPWTVELLMFSANWFKHLDDPAWRDLYLHLLKSTWQYSKYWRNKFVWDFTYTEIQKRRGLKPNPYIADTVKHLISIALGSIPGHAPAVDDGQAPISRIQDAYMNVYGLKKYYPTLMIPKLFTPKKDSRSVYYSLHFPTAIELSLKASEHSSTITDLYEVSSLISKYYDEWFALHVDRQEQPAQAMLQSVVFDYFHTDASQYVQISPVSKLAEDDSSFCQTLVDCHYHRFCVNSSFVRGCIRIASS